MNDIELLNSLDSKLQLVRDRVRGVAEGFHTGFYLWGEGGTSKSFTVEETLRHLKKPYKLTNTRISGRGFFNLLREFPDSIHVLEDVETMFSDKTTYCLLRAALWAQQERIVCWQTAHQREEFAFTGGIIVTANCPLNDTPQIRAIKTRITCLEHNPTNDEVSALLRSIASRGYEQGPYSLSADKCLEVVQEIIDQSSQLKRRLDIRLLVNTYKDRLQSDNGLAVKTWRELLQSRMTGRVTSPVVKQGIRSERKAKECSVLQRIAALPTQERLAAWVSETGKSQAAMYRRLGEISGDDSQISRLQQ